MVVSVQKKQLFCTWNGSRYLWQKMCLLVFWKSDSRIDRGESWKRNL